MEDTLKIRRWQFHREDEWMIRRIWNKGKDSSSLCSMWNSRYSRDWGICRQEDQKKESKTWMEEFVLLLPHAAGRRDQRRPDCIVPFSLQLVWSQTFLRATRLYAVLCVNRKFHPHKVSKQSRGLWTFSERVIALRDLITVKVNSWWAK